MARKILILVTQFICLNFCTVFGQVVSENFNTGIPASWTQNPAGTWTLNSFGTAGNNCIITEEPGSGTLTNSMQTFTFSLNTIINPTVSFMAAITKNNFVCGNILLSMNNGNGSQFVARWGSGFTNNTTYTINEGFDPSPPLDQENVIWQLCTHTIAPITNTLSLIFEAEFVNGGYILLDDIKVSGQPRPNPAGLSALESEMQINCYPNPLVGDILTIISNKASDIHLFNELGQDMQANLIQKSENTFEMDTSALPKGIYYLQARDGSSLSAFSKVIVP